MTSPRALEDTTMMGTTIEIVAQLELADEHNVEKLCGLVGRGLGVQKNLTNEVYIYLDLEGVAFLLMPDH
jgi:hypothetical protein